MRDAFGGVFMMRLLLVFIVVLVAFTAISFKYAKSFKVKNEIIDIIEQNQVKDLDLFFSIPDNIDRMKATLKKAEYKLSCRNGNGTIVNDAGESVGYCFDGVVVTRGSKSHDSTIVYNVNTYVYWEIGFLNTLLVLSGKDRDSEAVVGGTWKITGEAVVKY